MYKVIPLIALVLLGCEDSTQTNHQGSYAQQQYPHQYSQQQSSTASDMLVAGLAGAAIGSLVTSNTSSGDNRNYSPKAPASNSYTPTSTKKVQVPLKNRTQASKDRVGAKAKSTRAQSYKPKATSKRATNRYRSTSKRRSSSRRRR